MRMPKYLLFSCPRSQYIDRLLESFVFSYDDRMVLVDTSLPILDALYALSSDEWSGELYPKSIPPGATTGKTFEQLAKDLVGFVDEHFGLEFLAKRAQGIIFAAADLAPTIISYVEKQETFKLLTNEFDKLDESWALIRLHPTDDTVADALNYIQAPGTDVSLSGKPLKDLVLLQSIFS